MNRDTHTVASPPCLWTPTPERIAAAQVTRFARQVAAHADAPLDDYEALWRWSVQDPSAFWRAVWAFAGHEPWADEQVVIEDSSMPGARWLPGFELNYVNSVLRHAGREGAAVICERDNGSRESLAWRDWEKQVGALAAHLRALGVRPGDRVVAYLPNRPACIVAFHAVVSLGAVWSVAAPDLGVQGVLDRFGQVEPVVLIAADGYDYGGRTFDRADTVEALVAGLPSVRALIRVPATGCRPASPASVQTIDWDEALSEPARVAPVQVPFDHPLWIVYSSGTTGKPKPIVHGHGGIVLEHLKQMHLQLDLAAGDRFLWFSSTAWMMWNYNIAGLLIGATVCLYDGNPGKPDLSRLWRLVDELDVRFFGAGAAWFEACCRAGLRPRDAFALDALSGIGSTGSPLPPEAFDWIYSDVKKDVYLCSISGGTDFATACVGGAPTVPVYRGEIACRSLGCAVYAFDEAGNAVTDEVGELVITAPMPSMPTGFWDDPDMQRYRDSYFDVYPGIWRHGDWIRVTGRGSAVIYGRSDATINRQGIRMGTAELYQVVETVAGIADSLVVDLEFLGRESRLLLFVVLAEGVALDDALTTALRTRVREDLSPRHVPDEVIAIPEVPRTFSGKKMEIPVRRVLLGQSGAAAINRDTMANPAAIDWFVDAAASDRFGANS